MKRRKRVNRVHSILKKQKKIPVTMLIKIRVLVINKLSLMFIDENVLE